MNALIVLVLLDLLGQMRIVCFSWWKHGETSIRIVEAFCDPFANCRRASCIGCSNYQAWSWKAEEGWIMVHERNPRKVMSLATCQKMLKRKEGKVKDDLFFLSWFAGLWGLSARQKFWSLSTHWMQKCPSSKLPENYIHRWKKLSWTHCNLHLIID